jgi:hypothetical protein
LGDFSCIRAQDVEANNLVVVSSVHKHLAVAIATFWSCLVVLPLQGLEFLVVSQYVFSSKLLLSSFFIISASTIF